MEQRPSRRTVTVTVSGAGLLLAGCLGDDEVATGDDRTSAPADDSIGDETDDEAGAPGSTDERGDEATADENSEAADGGSDVGSSAELPAWMETPMEDVTTGDSFSIASFDRPVLVEPFAVWCGTCLAQQRETQTLHDRLGDAVVSVAVNVDPNEDPDDVREHAESYGFGWRWVVAPTTVTQSLVETFDQSIVNPPSAPGILVCDGETWRRLDDGVHSADDLEAEIEAGC